MITVVMRFLTLFLLLLGLSTEAATVYFKPTGTGSADGTSAANAVGQASVMSTASAGDLLVMCGTGFSSILVTKNDIKVFSADVNGATNKWSAELTGSSGQHGIYTSTGVTGLQVWGVHILSSYIDGIKFNGHTNTVRSCWIENAGRPVGWSTNSDGSFSGQGIGWHGYNEIVIEENIIENCGAYITLDHLIYGMGTNVTIRGNVLRGGVAWGLQIYDDVGDNHNWVVANNLIYGNGSPGVSQGGLVIYTHGAKTNYIYGNTIISSSGKYGMIISQDSSSARLYVSNNIVQGDAGYGILAVTGAGGTNTVKSDYNLVSAVVTGEPRGGNDVTGTATFDSTAAGRYWLTSASAGRNAAAPAICHLVDFWGRAQSTVADIGAFQYEASLEADSRDHTDTQRDYWVREPAGLLVSRSGTSHLLSWTEQNQHHVQFEIQRKDSVNDTYALMATVNKGTLTYDDSGTKTNGVTYTYSMSPVTSLGNAGGINTTPTVAQLYNAVNGQIALKAFRF